MKKILERVDEENSVVIRSTPMTGKTLLLQLVAKAVLEGPYKLRLSTQTSISNQKAAMTTVE